MADVTDSPDLGGLVPAESGDPVGQVPARKTGLAGSFSLLVRGWLRYRAWRRSRPFWAGLWLIISGAELLLIPLPIRNMGIILHIGIGGISGILIGAVLILLGLLLWIFPGQRVFYSIVAVFLAVGALVASNLGGFLIGTVLGVIGGSLGFAWVPDKRRRRRRRQQRPEVPDEGLALIGDTGPGAEARTLADTIPEADSQADAGAEGEAGTAAATGKEEAGTAAATGKEEKEDAATAEDVAITGSATQSGPADSGHGTISREFALLPALALAGLVHLAPATATAASASASPSASPSAPASASPSAPASATPSVSASAPPSVSASATPSAPASATASAPASATSSAPAAPAPAPSTAASTPGSTSPTASASPQPSASAGSANSASSAASPTSSPNPSSTPTGTPPPLAVSTAQATLIASSASLTGFTYDGVVSVPTASGSAQMMEFSATSIDLSGAQLTVSLGGTTTMSTTASSLDYDGKVVLYVTEFSGDLLGSSMTITPSTPLATIQQWLGQGTASQPLALQVTNLTTLQPYASANSLTADTLQMS